MRYKHLRHRLDSLSLLDENGCWVWQGCVNNSGYGKLNVRLPGRVHKQLYAHRAAFEEYIRPLAAHEEVDHTCCNRLCINPLHLEAVTRSENAKLSHSRKAAKASNTCK